MLISRKKKNELILKIESSRNKRNYEDIGKENYYEKIIYKIEGYSINSQKAEVNRLIKAEVDRLIKIAKNKKSKKRKKYEISKVECNYDIDSPLFYLFGE